MATPISIFALPSLKYSFNGISVYPSWFIFCFSLYISFLWTNNFLVLSSSGLNTPLFSYLDICIPGIKYIPPVIDEKITEVGVEHIVP